MTQGQRTLLIILAVVVLGVLLVGTVILGVGWYRLAAEVDRQVNALLDEVREDEPDGAQSWLIQLGLTEDQRTDRERDEAVDHLVERGASAVPELILALLDKDRDVRKTAARALGELGDPRAVEPLEELLDDEDADVRKAATDALQKLRGNSEAAP